MGGLDGGFGGADRGCRGGLGFVAGGAVVRELHAVGEGVGARAGDVLLEGGLLRLGRGALALGRLNVGLSLRDGGLGWIEALLQGRLGGLQL